MSARKGTLTALVCLICLGIVYLISAQKLGGATSTTLGPGYFPTILGIALIVMCIISGVQTFRKPDKQIKIPNLKLVFLTILIIAVYFIAWNTLGYFYLCTFIFLFILFMLYRHNQENLTKIFIPNILMSIIITLIIFVVFDVIMSVRF